MMYSIINVRSTYHTVAKYVNKTLEDKLNAAQGNLICDEMVEIGSFNLHALHNAFREGLKAVDSTWAWRSWQPIPSSLKKNSYLEVKL
jgi:hypothetical protein